MSQLWPVLGGPSSGSCRNVHFCASTGQLCQDADPWWRLTPAPDQYLVGGGSPASRLTLGMMSPSSGDLRLMTTDQVQLRGADVATHDAGLSRSCVNCSLCVLCDTGQCGTQWGEQGVCQQPHWPTVGKVEKKEDRGCPLVATEPGQWPEGSVSHRLGPAPDCQHYHHPRPQSDSHPAMLKQWLSKRNSCNISKMCVWTSLLG